MTSPKLNVPDAPSFSDLMQRVRSGDDRAAAALFESYARRLIGLARVKLDERLRAKVDAEDVVQSAFRTFFRRHAAGEFAFGDRDDLWRLLALITVRKCGRWRATYRAANKALQRETAPDLSSGDSIERWEACGEEPTPAEAASLADTVQAMLASLPSDMHRQVLTLHLQGYTAGEIAAAVDRTQATVRRVMGSVRESLTRLAARSELD